MVPALAVAALFCAGVYVVHSRSDDLATARAETRAAVDMSHAAIARADLEAESAAIHRAEAVASTNRADSLERVSRPATILYKIAESAAPAPCAPALTLADSVISNRDGEIVALRGANQGLFDALDSTTVALAGLRAAQVNLAAKATDLVQASAPSRLLPKPGFGLAAGIDATGRPQILFGVTLSWGR